MKQCGPVRSAMPPHGRHANATGTDAPADDGPDRCPDAGGRNSGALIASQNSVRAGLKIDVRQGIA
jgi:hypothetical protein